MGDKENEKKQATDTRTLAIFSAASFLNDMGSDMVFSVWPVFVRSLTGADMAMLGLIDGLGEATLSFSQAVSGYVSDRIGKRKLFVWGGYLLSAFSRIGYAVSTSFHMLIPFKFLDRLGKIRSAPRDAMIADSVPHERRGQAFGVLRMMDNLGAVVGILLAIFLFTFMKESYRTVFILAAIPSCVATALVFFMVRERSTERIHRGFELRDISQNLWVFLIGSAIFSLANFSYSFFIVAATTGVFAETAAPLLYLAFTVSASAFSLPFGRLIDKIGRKKMLAFAYILFFIVCVGFASAKSKLVMAALMLLYGAHLGALQPSQSTFVSELAPKKYRASVLGIFKMISGILALPASLIAGMLWNAGGISAPFTFSALLTCISLVLLLFVKEQEVG
ncbi:MAG: MFS transporter [Candidatus Micrarchaeia archaeon]